MINENVIFIRFQFVECLESLQENTLRHNNDMTFKYRFVTLSYPKICTDVKFCIVSLN